MSISKSYIDEMNISALINEYVYCDEQKEQYNGESLYTIITELSPPNSQLRKKFSEIKEGSDLEKQLKEITVVSQSMVDGEISKGELIACAFKTNDGNLYVAYRGTGDGKWVDNGVAMAKKDSLMQRRAGEYFDYVMEHKGISHDGELFVTGHSKGGNSAQYVALTSKHADRINRVYSIDGQGFSNEALRNIQIDSDFYNAQINKMYSINGNNDYVHELGNIIIKAENTILLNSMNGNGIEEWHVLSGLINKETWKLNFSYDEYDNLISVEQGPVGRFAKELSEKVMRLDDESLEDCTVSIMSLLEFFMGDGDVNVATGTGDVKFATTEEFHGFINIGIPLIINTIRESENINEVLELMGYKISTDHWLAEPLFDILIDISEDMTIDELEGYINLGKEISNYAKEHGMSTGDLINYIKDDPLRLIEIYSSMDMSQKSLHEAICKIFAPKNIARIAGAFAKEHPMMTAGAVAALSNPMIRGALISVASFIVVGGAIYLIANHIIVIVNWDSIKEAIIQGSEYVKDKIAEMYTALVNKINEEINEYVADVLSTVEKIITVGERVIDFAGDKIEDFMGFMQDACKVAIKTLFMLSNPILYLIASKLYNSTGEPVRINMVKLRQCVNTMNRLASRVASIDSRLDNLYYQLSRNNIEQGEDIFTSLANIYNLFRADLNVDEGQTIKRKARALTELFEDCEKTDRWVTNNVPQGI